MFLLRAIIIVPYHLRLLSLPDKIGLPETGLLRNPAKCKSGDPG